MNLDSMFTIFPAVIIGLTVHEWAHAYTGYKLGDMTARDQGRLTLNPLKHLDPFGTLLILILGFGWAKPVQFNPDNLKHKHRDEILIAFAGPFSNLVLGILFLVVARVLYGFTDQFSADSHFAVINTLVLWAVVNFGLAIFNMIPIPPLDGSHVYTTFVTKMNPQLAQQMYRFGFLALFGILMIENFSGMDILPIGRYMQTLTGFLMHLLGFN